MIHKADIPHHISRVLNELILFFQVQNSSIMMFKPDKQHLVVVMDAETANYLADKELLPHQILERSHHQDAKVNRRIVS